MNECVLQLQLYNVSEHSAMLPAMLPAMLQTSALQANNGRGKEYERKDRIREKGARQP